MKKTVAFFYCMTFFSNGPFAQHFTHADTLRGSNGPGRRWWDATNYDLHVRFNLSDSAISGYNIISYNAVENGAQMQIDLQEPMVIDSIKSSSTPNTVNLAANDVSRDGNAYFVNIPNVRKKIPPLQ